MTKDSTTLYLFMPNQRTGNCMLKGLLNKIESVEVLGTHKKLEPKIVGKVVWSKVPGLVFIDVPDAVKDPYITVLKIKLDGPLKLYRGTGGLEL